MTDECGAKYPTGLDRCSLAAHGNTVKHFDERTGREWGGKEPKGNPHFPPPRPPRSPLKPRSEKKIKDDETWAFIKECFMACHPFCVDCGRAEDDTWTLDLDHVVSRGRGGRSVPTNAALRCRHRFDRNRGCHPTKHGVPMFSGSEEEAG